MSKIPEVRFNTKSGKITINGKISTLEEVYKLSDFDCNMAFQRFMQFKCDVEATLNYYKSTI